MAALKLLFSALEELKDYERKKFSLYLTEKIQEDLKPISRGRLENYDVNNVVEQMRQSYGTERSLRLTSFILNLMNYADLAQRLDGQTRLQWDTVEMKAAKIDAAILLHHKTSMKTRFQHAFEGAGLKRNRTLISDIYTELRVVERSDDDEREVCRVKTGRRTARCSDLLKEDSARRTLTRGVAGIGKTVSVHKFIVDWAEQEVNQHVHFLFVLPFRELNLIEDDEYSLHQLLLAFHPELTHVTPEDYADCNVMFVFDGLDESRLPLNFVQNRTVFSVTKKASVDVLLTSLIRGNLFPSARIWITSRPAAASKIPSDYIDQVTEIQGFSDEQKEEYFRKRISNEAQANRVISHLKKSKSLYAMCYIPVFCWISATVLKKQSTSEIPKTLTEMFTFFLLILVSMKNQKFHGASETDRQKLLQSNKDVLLKLSKLAYEHLVKGNLMFDEEDLMECGIDATDASLYSGMCNEILKKDAEFFQKKVYCFVHLNVQEFLAALFAFFSYVDSSVTSGQMKLHDFLKKEVVRALESESGHLDLYLRFLLGISVESNQKLLQGLLPRTPSGSEDREATITYIKSAIRHTDSPDRCFNLLNCLTEMDDRSMLEEVQRYLRFKMKLSAAQCSALVYMLLMSEEVLDGFNPWDYTDDDEGCRRLMPAVSCCRNAQLRRCCLKREAWVFLASVLSSGSSHLRHLDLSYSDLQESGVKMIISELKSPHCKLESLRMRFCSLTVQHCEVLASVLSSGSSHLRHLDLSENDLLDSGVEILSTGVRSPHCTLEILGLSGCCISERGCEFLSSALSSNPSYLRELDLSYNHPGEAGVKLLTARLQDPHCKLEKLKLTRCHLKRACCEVLASALSSDSSHLRHLDLSENDLQDSGVQIFSGLKSPHCKLETLSLSGCCISERGCEFLSSALSSNPSYLRELDLSYNHPGEAGVKLLTARLQDPHCKLEKLNVDHDDECRLRSGPQKYFREFTLDPGTADMDLTLSEGNRTVTFVDRGFTRFPLPSRDWEKVLCRECVSAASQRCYWEVDMRGVDVDVGVACEGNAGFWLGDSDGHRRGRGFAQEPASPYISNRVGVYLDWSAGTVTFYSVSSDGLTHLHTFHSTFTQPLYPALRVRFGLFSSVTLCWRR
ncbi:NACHT, LRR and PYD domains-containing protein 12-like isoform X2 [Denticeps clupeoides]|uniref:NACHT, LRR and PYD domains-containing protein 12-like isoform X2 n=1 Tax=Denticeps clupeoides TaxID=299321 RepID=UPI0010A54282|nr:NACHT, LRR and PYD domains-containing protein 12-like isoform X2 [Denticeps clupeoides]